MVKLVYCISKRQDLSDEEFFRYWKTVHGPIGARIPRLRKLVQSHRVIVPGDEHPPDYDGMAELWFDDADALLAARQSPEWKASTEDEANFVDHTKFVCFVSEEHTIFSETVQQK
jgi:uncharacterized protein (TIGR02118 family)